MPRSSRLINDKKNTSYHVISRTALSDYPFGDVDKDEFVTILKRLSKVYFTEIHGYAMMGNHFHLLVTMRPEDRHSKRDMKKRYRLYYGDDAVFPTEMMTHFQDKWGSLAEFVREIKQTFSRFYNKTHNRRGTLWGGKFKSVIVEQGETLLNCLAYIDLNAVRAGLVKQPEKYDWCSLGYLAQTKNSDGFLSTNFGLAEFADLNEAQRYKRYQTFVYEAGDLKKSNEKRTKTVTPDIIDKKQKINDPAARTQRFMNKTRYFSDSGVIGSKAFVSEHYHQFKHLFQSKHEKKPKPIKGLEGIYSLKRLT